MILQAMNCIRFFFVVECALTIIITIYIKSIEEVGVVNL